MPRKSLPSKPTLENNLNTARMLMGVYEIDPNLPDGISIIEKVTLLSQSDKTPNIRHLVEEKSRALADKPIVLAGRGKKDEYIGGDRDNRLHY